MTTSVSNNTRLSFVFYSSVAFFFCHLAFVSALIFYYLERYYSRGNQPT